MARSMLHYAISSLIAYDAQPGNNSVDTLALLFYEGKHTDMNGRSRTYKVSDLQKIVDATNEWLSQGNRVKLYASDADHLKISQASTIGWLTSTVELREITESLLPNPRMTPLLGKQGLFAHVRVVGAENVAQYHDTRLKELSIGLDSKNRIVEVTATAIPALAGASLYAHDRAEFPFALTLSDQVQENTAQRAEDQVWMLFEAFLRVLRDIRDASPEQLGTDTPDQLRERAIADLNQALRSRLLPTPTPEPLPTIPLFSMQTENETPEVNEDTESTEISAAQAATEQLKQELSQLKREMATTARYSALREKANGLVTSGKMQPAQFKAVFGDEQEAAIARFSAVGNNELDSIEFLLGQLEQFAAPVKMGLPAEGGADPGDPDGDEAVKKADNFLASYSLPRSY